MIKELSFAEASEVAIIVVIIIFLSWGIYLDIKLVTERERGLRVRFHVYPQ